MNYSSDIIDLEWLKIRESMRLQRSCGMKRDRHGQVVEGSSSATTGSPIKSLPAVPKADPNPLFPQFSALPRELRLKIWRESWEHRNVNITRQCRGLRGRPEDAINAESMIFEGAIILYLQHRGAILRDWGVTHDAQGFNLGQTKVLMCTNFITRTRSTANFPISLWVNRESRRETLRFFKTALALPDGVSRHLPGGESRVYFNFNLDVLVFPVHNSLSTAFSQSDLSQVRRISIPELVPTLPSFAVHTGPYDKKQLLNLPKTEDEDKVLRYEEFRYTWRLLRRWFPCLREIRLEVFHSCKHYGSTSHSFHSHNCNSCSNIRAGINRRFPSLGMGPATGQQDFDRVLDCHDIMQPVFKEETLIIGQVPGDHKGEVEDITVTFRAIYEGDKSKDLVNLKARAIDWDMVKRMCVAKTLEHALGPQTDELMVYNID